MFRKKPKEEKVEAVEECPSVSVDKAKDIADKYAQLSECCRILAEVKQKEKRYSIRFGDNGWRVWEHQLSQAGIDKEEVYSFIECLARKRKAQLESELAD